MFEVRDVRSQWERLQTSPNTTSKQKELPEGNYTVAINSMKFFEANNNLPECLMMRYDVVSGEHKGIGIKSTNYFGSRKSILYWRSSVKKIVPLAFEMKFDDVLLQLEKFIKTKRLIQINVSYSSNGNGKQYTNIKFIGMGNEVDKAVAETTDKVLNQEPF